MRMLKLSIFLCLLQLPQFAVGGEPRAVIRGTLKEDGVPIQDAAVYLQSFDNEDCANIVKNEARDPKSAAKLASCIRDAGTTNVDATGSYHFSELKPGWYAVHFLWNIKDKPDRFPASIVVGQWRALYAGHKDSTAKYDSMAQDVPIYVAPGSEIQRDFERAYIAQEAKPLRGRLSLPTKNWGVVLDLPGFTLRILETRPDGSRYMVAENESSNVVVSLTLKESKENAPVESCRQYLEEKTHRRLEIHNVRFSRSGDVDIMRYMVAESKGRRLNQESMFACQFYDKTYIDLHVSNVGYVPADEPLFANVLASMHTVAVRRSSMDLVGEASRVYLQHDYKAAIGPYAQALELEKENPTLEKSLLYVLIDNLGMSYGITGNLQKARETFEYGVSRDPKYPLFYYNLACTHAEMGDAAGAEDYLKKAFEYRTNVLPGESMPDPRTDPSFRELMRNKEFREVAEGLAKSH